MFGRCDMRFNFMDSCNVEGIFVQRYLPKLRAEVHLIHELVHAWLFLSRSHNGYSSLLRSGHSSDDDLEEVLCNLAALEYVKRVAKALIKTSATSTLLDSLERARFYEKMCIARFLSEKLKRNSGREAVFARGYSMMSTLGWVRLRDSIMSTGTF